jgi:acyl-CoA synthetase (AMP-forming)/AMP-acid ligase II
MTQKSFVSLIQGTTGHPKAMLATHHSLVNNAIIVGKHMELDAEVLYICAGPPRSNPNIYSFDFFLVCEAIGTAATPGLLYQPRLIVKMTVEKQMECRLARETEVLGENLPKRHFCPSQNPTHDQTRV